MTAIELNRNWLLLRLWRLWAVNAGCLPNHEIVKTADWLDENGYLTDARLLRTGTWTLSVRLPIGTSVTKGLLRSWLKRSMIDCYIPRLCLHPNAEINCGHRTILGHMGPVTATPLIGVYPMRTNEYRYATAPTVPIRLRR